MVVGLTRIRVYPKAQGVAVRERSEHRRHPEHCLERHLPADGSFCLGRLNRAIRANHDATAWWSDLHYFLALQAIAEQTGAWPAIHALSHGPDAAAHEIAARAIARMSGIEEDYNRSVEGEANWLAACVDGARPPEGMSVGRNALAHLVAEEKKRRRALDEYWQQEFKSGRRCCGTMNECPLRDYEQRVKIAAE